MPPPAAARRRTRRGRARKAPAFHVSDWADLPADAISCVLHKLDHVELLLGGVAGVCRSWRRAAREEPELWRRIELHRPPDMLPFTWRARLGNIMRAALRLSAGQCDTFLGELLDDDLFLFLAQQVPSLKRLNLIKCYFISTRGFAKAIKKLPLLEELQIINYSFHNEEVLELVAKGCRCLKHFKLVVRQECWNSYGVGRRYDDDRNAFAIAGMSGLRSLILVSDNLGNEGLTAIINNCPHLEYLEVRDCYNINMDYNLTVKCSRITMDYHEYFPPSGPCSCLVSPFPLYSGGLSDNDTDDYHDLSLYSYLGDDIDGANFDEYERILDIKSMRRYLK